MSMAFEWLLSQLLEKAEPVMQKAVREGVAEGLRSLKPDTSSRTIVLEQARPSTTLSTKDAAKECGYTPATLIEWMRAGRLQGAKLGRHWRVDQKDLARLMAGGQPAPRLVPSLESPQDEAARVLGSLNRRK